MFQTNHQRLLSDDWRYDAGRYQDPQTGDWLDERKATERAFWRDWASEREKRAWRSAVEAAKGVTMKIPWSER